MSQAALVPSTPVRNPLAPVDQSQWQKDSEITHCNSCGTSFGLFTRKHHCRQDGRIYCSKCSDAEWRINGVLSRVCLGCHAALTQARADRLKDQQVNAYERKPSFGATTANLNAASNSNRKQSNPDLMQQISNTMAIFSDSSSSVAAASSSTSSSSPATTAAASISSAQLARESVERLIYRTASLCPRCSLLEKRGFDSGQYKPAELFEQYRGIWLRATCERHGRHVTLVCKDRNFWWRCYSFEERYITSLKVNNIIAGDIPRSVYQGISNDIEDIGKMMEQTLRSAQPPVDNMPLSFELALFVDGTFVADAELDAKLLAFVKRFPQQGRGSTFLLKLIGGLVDKSQIPLLNDKILRIVGIATAASKNSQTKAHPILTPALLNVRILVDVSYERLVDLLLLEKSVFLKVRVLPCVRYFLTPGEEPQFEVEMDYLLSLVREISDLELILSLSLESPYPDMMKILNYIQRYKGLIRFILISRERSPRSILNRLHADVEAEKNTTPAASSLSSASSPATAERATSQPSPNLTSYPESIDPYELLESMEASTRGLLRPSDFIPVSVGQLFEPVGLALGYGSWHVNPSPFCGFVATLVTTEKLSSIPITRLFDIEQLYSLLLPISQKMKYGKEKPSIGITLAKQVQKAMKQCAYNVETPDVVSYVASGTIDKAKSATITNFVNNLQMLIVHNRMDFASIDLHRRCKCANVTDSPLDPTQQIAICTGCV